MSLERFLLGALVGMAMALSVAAGAGALRRRLLPGWRGLEARLVEIVLAVTTVTLVAEAAGTVGLFRLAPVAAGVVLVGLAPTAPLLRGGAAGGATGRPPARSPGPPIARWQLGAVVAGVVPVVGAWLLRTDEALRRGVTTVDSTWYHLPVAARFVQTGFTTRLHYVDTDSYTPFFPATSSLLHAVGILLAGSDLPSTVLNLGWLALALAAGWCVGRPKGVPAASTLAVALVMATPAFVATQPGGAYNDVPGIALVLCAVAIGLRGPPAGRSEAQDVLAGLALGLAAGMKLSFVGPAAAVAVALVVTGGRRRWARRTGGVAAAALLAGGYWYVRNLVRAGNPVPSVALRLGPFALPSIAPPEGTAPIGRFLFDGRAWTGSFVPGLRLALGPAWVAVVVLALAGLVAAALVRRDRRVVALAAAGAAGLVLFVITPQFLMARGEPRWFFLNVRYAGVPLALGLVLGSAALVRWAPAIVAALLAAVYVSQLDPTSWPTGFDWAVYLLPAPSAGLGRAVAVAGAGSTLAILAAVAWCRSDPGPVRAGAALLAAAAVVVVPLAVTRGPFLDHRYDRVGENSWARQVTGARIAVAGALPFRQYPLYGLDLSNTVQFAGIEERRGRFRPIRSCAEWTAFLTRGHYDYAVAGGSPFVIWTAFLPGVRQVVQERTRAGSSRVGFVVFRPDARRGWGRC